MLDKERLGEMLTFKQSPKGNEGVKKRWQFGRRMGRGVGTAGPEAGVCWGLQRNSKEAWGAGAGGAKGTQ